jgi:protein MpaA
LHSLAAVPPTLRPRRQRGVPPSEPAIYGRSSQDRPLEVWLPTGTVSVLVFAGIHGEEPETTVALSSALRSLPEDDLRCAVVLAANPDGLARGTRGNARGVDLNRNFPSADWSADASGHRFTRSDPQDVLLSPGPQPASEPETAALMSLAAQLGPRVIISLHSPLECVIDPELSGSARWLADAATMPLRRSLKTRSPGTFDSWAREQLRAISITFEFPVLSKDAALVRFLPALVDLLRGAVEGLD